MKYAMQYPSNAARDLSAEDFSRIADAVGTFQGASDLADDTECARATLTREHARLLDDPTLEANIGAGESCVCTVYRTA